MQLLIADDDDASLRWLTHAVTQWAYKVITINNADAALCNAKNSGRNCLAVYDV